MIQLVQVALKFILLTFLLDLIPMNETDLFSSGPISVRESTVDFQIRVDHKIFVFEKANGNLEKVKVGMHVLPFAQVPKIEGLESSFKNFTWKRTKDGSIQIRSFYSPDSAILIWTIFQDGRLKFEAVGENLKNQDFLGLGFDFQEDGIKHVNWENSIQEPGEYSFESVSDKGNVLEVQSFSVLNLDFNEVKVGVKTETPQSHFRISADDNNQGHNSIVNLNFLFYSLPNQSLSEEPGTPNSMSVDSFSKGNFDRDPIVLWFDFH
jgi:hypothetical protein